MVILICCFQSSLLTHAIRELLAVLSQPTPDDPDQQKDIPHVHAMNILKAVFRESSVALAAMPYLATAVIHAIEGFASPYWSVRNGAIQLFGKSCKCCQVWY